MDKTFEQILKEKLKEYETDLTGKKFKLVTPYKITRYTAVLNKLGGYKQNNEVD